MIRIAVADDHTFTREGLEKIISSETDLEFSGSAASAAELQDLLAANKIDILILDINLPDRNGLELLKDLVVYHPRLKVIMLSMHSESLFALRTLKAGAWGYLTKGAPSELLLKAIRKVAGGRKYISESFAEDMAMDMATDDNRPLFKRLTDREFEVFTLLAMGKTLKTISEQLTISISTANTYRRRILKKMNMDSNFELTYYAIQNKIIEL